MKLGSYRITVARLKRPAGQTAAPSRAGRQGMLAGVVALTVMLAFAPYASAQGSVTGTIYTQTTTYSLTVSPSTVSLCSADSPLTYPSGQCSYGDDTTTPVADGITITNTGAAGDIDISGSNAVPSDGGTPWTLCDPTTSGSCSGPSRPGIGGSKNPGQDQYAVEVLATLPSATFYEYLSESAQCDGDFAATEAAASCAAGPGASQEEALMLVGPSASTDTSSTFTTTITWTVGPS